MGSQCLETLRVNIVFKVEEDTEISSEYSRFFDGETLLKRGEYVVSHRVGNTLEQHALVNFVKRYRKIRMETKVKGIEEVHP